MMRAFLPKEKVIQVFGHDLFEDESLVPLFNELLGISGIKPFECVGTNEEMLLAFRLAFKTNPDEMNVMMQLFRERILSQMKDSDFLALQEKLLAN